MSSFNLYILCFIVPLIIGLAVQAWLRKTFADNSQKPVASGMSGADVAREILDRNGLQNVPVQPSKAGPLSDHYDPRRRAACFSASPCSPAARWRRRPSPPTRWGTPSSTPRPTCP